jgi:hypothetical protein
MWFPFAKRRPTPLKQRGVSVIQLLKKDTIDQIYSPVLLILKRNAPLASTIGIYP